MARYADKPSVELAIDIAASPEAVWNLITDINLPAQFSNEFKGAAWLGGAEPALGAQFVGRNSFPGGNEWETTCTVVWFEPQRSFGYAVVDVDDPAARWRFDLEPTDHGTRLTMWAEMGPGRSGISYLIYKNPDQEDEIIASRLVQWRDNMEATLAGVKTLAEGSVASH